jgi:hypothetical protein
MFTLKSINNLNGLTFFNLLKYTNAFEYGKILFSFYFFIILIDIEILLTHLN